MKLEILDIPFRIEDLAVTDFGDVVEERVKKIKNQTLDFSSIQLLKGDKEILNKAFLTELGEQISD